MNAGTSCRRFSWVGIENYLLNVVPTSAGGQSIGMRLSGDGLPDGIAATSLRSIPATEFIAATSLATD